MKTKTKIKSEVREILKRSFSDAQQMLDKIIKNATLQQLNETGAVCDIYTAIMEDQARQLRTNPKQYSLSLHRKSRKRVREFWWLGQK